MDTLNPKQAAFVREYIVGGNATQAAKRAGYSEKTAHVQGSALLRHPVVKAAIQEGWNRAAADGVATYDEACLRMSEILRQRDDPYASIKAADRLAKLRGWDQPSRVQTEDVTPARYDLSRLDDAELAAFEAALAKVTPP
jgi:phage terminase small subunit